MRFVTAGLVVLAQGQDLFLAPAEVNRTDLDAEYQGCYKRIGEGWCRSSDGKYPKGWYTSEKAYKRRQLCIDLCDKDNHCLAYSHSMKHETCYLLGPRMSKPVGVGKWGVDIDHEYSGNDIFDADGDKDGGICMKKQPCPRPVPVPTKAPPVPVRRRRTPVPVRRRRTPAPVRRRRTPATTTVKPTPTTTAKPPSYTYSSLGRGFCRDVGDTSRDRYGKWLAGISTLSCQNMCNADLTCVGVATKIDGSCWVYGSISHAPAGWEQVHGNGGKVITRADGQWGVECFVRTEQ